MHFFFLVQDAVYYINMNDMMTNLQSRMPLGKKIRPKQERADEVTEQMLESIQKILKQRRTLSDKLADFLVRSAGTISIIILHIIIFAVWIAANLNFIPAIPVFDPYPFNFLTMTVSLEAIFLAIFVLMSQNRESRIADLRQEFDVQVNVVAEREITKIIHLLSYIMTHLDIPFENDEELKKMMQPLNIDEIREQLEHQIGTAKKPKTEQAAL